MSIVRAAVLVILPNLLHDRVLKQDSQHPAALRGAALAHVALRQYPRSRDMLERLLATNEEDAEVWLDLGDVLFMMGDRAGALARWNRAAGMKTPRGADPAAKDIISRARRRLKLYGPLPANGTADATAKSD